MVPEVDPGRAARAEEREGCLEEHASCFRDDISIIDGALLLRRHRVEEGVAEIGKRHPQDAVPPFPRRQDPSQGSESSRVEREDPSGRRRVDRHAGAAEAAIEQDLDEETAEGVADQDRAGGHPLEDRLVMVDDFLDTEAAQRGRRRATLRLDSGLLPRPRRRGCAKSLLLEVGGEGFPAQGRHPGAVNEDDRRIHVSPCLPGLDGQRR